LRLTRQTFSSLLKPGSGQLVRDKQKKPTLARSSGIVLAYVAAD